MPRSEAAPEAHAAPEAGAWCWGTSTVGITHHGASLRVFDPRPPCVGAVIDEALTTWGEREFLVQGEARWTFRDVAGAIGSASRLLSELGVARGARVVLLAGNSPAWVVVFLALQRMGATAVLGNGWWRPDEIEHAIVDVGASLVVADRACAERLGSDPGGRHLVDLEGLAARDAQAPAPRAAVDETEPSYVVFTSGTTSRPKAALLSHRSTVANLHNILVRTHQLPPLDPARAAGVSLCAVPLFHISGIQTILQHLVVGARLVFLEGRFDPGRVLQTLESEGVTTWTAVPTMLAMVLDHPDIDVRDLSSVRSLAVGGAPVPPELLERAHERFTRAARRLAVSYGSTEAGGTVATGLHDSAGGALEPLPTVDVMIAEPDAHLVGELLVRAPTLMDGYLGVPASEQPIDAAGWLHTGDLAVPEGDERFRIVGRVKDVIIRGGENVAAVQVEAVVRSHPQVADAAVVGIPHPVWGEEVGVMVVARADSTVSEQVLHAYVAARLPHYAVPTRWSVCREQLPLTDTGKVAKQTVRAALMADEEVSG